jgi:FtsP/CotA-like multicopper oxidase with cupredoxin domain
MPDNEISDVAYDRFLINGRPESWIPANPGDRIRLRLVNAGASTYFYVQFAGGPMTVVAADGLDVEPFVTDRLLISIAETYDVIVRVPQNGTFEFRATAMDGSGSTSAFIDAGDQRFAAPDVPKPDYYQNTTNAGFLRAMWQTAWAVRGRTTVGGERANPNTPGMHMEMAPPAPGRPATPYAELVSPESTVIAGTRPVREVVLHLTGDMERYVWSMNGKTLSEQHEIPIKKGEVVRFVMINRTMMHHPMHLHGHFFRVLNGRGDRSPLKHTVDVAPMATTVIEFKANAEKDWFFHCHLLYHLGRRSHRGRAPRAVRRSLVRLWRGVGPESDELRIGPDLEHPEPRLRRVGRELGGRVRRIRRIHALHQSLSEPVRRRQRLR